MNFLEISYLFRWYITIFLLGIAVFPLVSIIFKNFKDSGWGFAKTVGLVLTSYLTWIFGSIKIIPFGNWLFAIVLIEAFLIWLLAIKKSDFRFNRILNNKIKIIIAEELIFAFSFLGYLFIRIQKPEIQGLEKYMDFGFLNSILQSKYFPPSDMWFANETINYYYFGHLTAAVLTKLSFINSSVAYNLHLATIFSLTAVAVFSILFTLTKNYFVSVITVLLLQVAGNLHPITVLKTGLKGYWYANASRLDPFIINEFPVYSFIVADLHGHLLDLPIVVLIIGLVVNMVLEQKLIRPAFWLLAISIGATYATNSWDFPIYLTLSISSIGLVNILQKSDFKFAIFKTIISGLILTFSSVILFSPFYLQFKPLTSGIGFVTNQTPINLLLTMWGLWLYLVITFLLLFVFKFFKKQPIDWLIILFCAASMFLIITPEFIYVKDIYANQYYRANTIFKLYYQAWILLSFVGGWTLYRFFKIISRQVVYWGLFWVFFLIILLVPALSYPFLAIRSFYGGFGNYTGVDGTAYLRFTNPSDYKAIEWFLENAKNQPTIVEAVGDSYTTYGRISSYSGLPTVMGWPVHEWLWRGSFDEPGKRISEVKDIYTSENLEGVKLILDKYNVSFVYVGELEREKYSNINEDNLLKLGKVVFSEGNAKIYQVKTE